MNFYHLMSKRSGGGGAAYDWTVRTNTSTSHNYSIAYGNGYWNMSSQVTETNYSSDGVTWHKVTQSSNAARGGSFGNGYHIVHGFSSFIKYSSGAPPSIWSSASCANYDYILASCYCGSSIRWIGVTYTGYIVRRDSTTPNGTWTSPVRPVTTALRSVAMGSTYAVAVGDAGACYRSSDGTTWNSATSGFGTDNIFGVGYGNGYFVIVGQDGKLSTSTNDGSSWTLNTSTTIPTGAYVTNVVYDTTKNRWACAGNGGKIYTTSGNDPTGAWSSEASGTTESITKIAYGDGYLVASGNNGLVITSFS